MQMWKFVFFLLYFPFALIDNLRVFPHNFEWARVPLSSCLPATIAACAIDTVIAVAMMPFCRGEKLNQMIYLASPKTATDFCWLVLSTLLHRLREQTQTYQALIEHSWHKIALRCAAAACVCMFECACIVHNVHIVNNWMSRTNRNEIKTAKEQNYKWNTLKKERQRETILQFDGLLYKCCVLHLNLHLLDWIVYVFFLARAQRKIRFNNSLNFNGIRELNQNGSNGLCVATRNVMIKRKKFCIWHRKIWTTFSMPTLRHIARSHRYLKWKQFFSSRQVHS